MTTRLTGLNGTLTIGTVAAGTSIYNSADLLNVEVNLAVGMEDMTALEDEWEVYLPLSGSWTARAEKLLATQQFLTALTTVVTTRDSVHIALARGGATAAGATIATGECFINAATLANPRGRMLETIEFQGTGALTPAA